MTTLELPLTSYYILPIFIDGRDDLYYKDLLIIEVQLWGHIETNYYIKTKPKNHKYHFLTNYKESFIEYRLKFKGTSFWEKVMGSQTEGNELILRFFSFIIIF